MAGKHGQKQAAAAAKAPMARWQKLVFVVALVVFVVSALMLGKYFFERWQGQQDYAALQAGVLSPEATDPAMDALRSGDLSGMANEEGRVFIQQDKMAALKAQYPDFAGWIVIPDTHVNYPIMHHGDNEYYLTHTYEGKANSCGAIFMEAVNLPDFTDTNTTLHGHNMRNGTMFHDLLQYRKQAFLDAHPYVYVILPTGELLQYAVFSAYATEADADYRSIGFGSAAEETAYWSTLKGRSTEVTNDVMPVAGDQVLTLSTCAYDFDDARYAVHAVLLDYSRAAGGIEE